MVLPQEVPQSAYTYAPLQLNCAKHFVAGTPNATLRLYHVSKGTDYKKFQGNS
jgi:hypothetical protein